MGLSFCSSTSTPGHLLNRLNNSPAKRKIKKYNVCDIKYQKKKKVSSQPAAFMALGSQLSAKLTSWLP